jgi:hypothetical protein
MESRKKLSKPTFLKRRDVQRCTTVVISMEKVRPGTGREAGQRNDESDPGEIEKGLH